MVPHFPKCHQRLFTSLPNYNVNYETNSGRVSQNMYSLSHRSTYRLASDGANLVSMAEPTLCKLNFPPCQKKLCLSRDFKNLQNKFLLIFVCHFLCFTPISLLLLLLHRDVTSAVTCIYLEIYSAVCKIGSKSLVFFGIYRL